jgi:hypothetical protein
MSFQAHTATVERQALRFARMQVFFGMDSATDRI